MPRVSAEGGDRKLSLSGHDQTQAAVVATSLKASAAGLVFSPNSELLKLTIPRQPRDPGRRIRASCQRHAPRLGR